ncbi:MAG: MBOAT family protein [Lachnospiraceae bacterium]|nr:MBOAT family protein [Candidatus Merdinaster equi]
MLFSSIPFLFYFLPTVLILYFLAPKAAKNAVLLVASLFFYAYGEPVYVLLMLGAIIVGYVGGILIERFVGRDAKKMERSSASKVVLICAIALCLGMLGFFKYANFFVSNFAMMTGVPVQILDIALPIGISFYTFQIISYLIDVYRGSVPAQRNFIHLATYVALFAQLIAGPIVRYKDVASELKDRKSTWDGVLEGSRRFIIGLSKKILIANVLGELVDIFRNSTGETVLFYWIYALVFSLHLYFDFSGYSDMAIGIGRIFGFHFPENFNYPYISASVTEFWRRWHMTLGSWFRDYVYIPLGGNRVGKARWFVNILIVWMLTGFWHGADWNYILWGLLFAILLVIEKAGLLRVLEKVRFAGHIYVIFVVFVSFVIFNASGIEGMLSDFGGMFGMAGLPIINDETLYYVRSYTVVIGMALVGATPLPKFIAMKLRNGLIVFGGNKSGELVWSFFETVVIAALLLMCTAFLIDGSFNPFLYFRF